MNKQSVLIVDDERSNLNILVNALEDEYNCIVAKSGEQALKHISVLNPDIILLDIMMSGITGYDVCQQLKADENTTDIPVIFITAMSDEGYETKGLEMGAVDYITKPFSPDLVRARVANHLLLKIRQDDLEKLVKKRTVQLKKMQEAIITAMGTLAEYRDPETGGHIKRTQYYVRALAEHLAHQPDYKQYLTRKHIEQLYNSAPLHDIGKVGVPDNILMKPGKLTDEEFEEMKKHTNYGYEAIVASEKDLDDESCAFMNVAKEIAYTHQEKWDGSGYPRGLKGNAIPISGRLMAVADVYDALISKRVYKLPFTHEKAVAIIKEGKGTHFDPDMVEAFLELEDKFRQIALEFADFDEERY